MGQHWTPRHLLRGFSSDKTNVWMYDKRDGQAPKSVSIGRAAQSGRAYSEPVEKLMATIEHAANPGVSAFREMTQPININQTAKLLLSYYVAMFAWQRNPRVRRHQIEMWDDEQFMTEQFAQIMEDWGGPPKGRGDVIDKVREAVLQKGLSRSNHFLSAGWEPGAVMRWSFHMMTWAVLDARSGKFTIPDSTMVRFSENAGLLDEHAAFCLPLSSSRVLLACWKGGPPGVVQYRRIDRDLVHLINKVGFGQAERFVYAGVCDDALNRAVQKSRPHHAKVGQKFGLSGENTNRWHLNWINENYDWLRAELCLTAPEHTHEWHPVAVEAPLPFSGQPTLRCSRCGCLKWRYPSGRVEFKNQEVAFVDADYPARNWWQRTILKTDEPGRITVEVRPDPHMVPTPVR